MQYRLLALDLDGTLVTSHGGITEAAKQAVWSYIDAGGVVALASGRPTRGLWPAQEPVSYTHLDVYKRQGYRGERRRGGNAVLSGLLSQFPVFKFSASREPH